VLESMLLGRVRGAAISDYELLFLSVSLSIRQYYRLLNFLGTQNSIPRNRFRQPTGRYNNPIPTRFLALDGLF
jgi:hypothetical protein